MSFKTKVTFSSSDEEQNENYSKYIRVRKIKLDESEDDSIERVGKISKISISESNNANFLKTTINDATNEPEIIENQYNFKANENLSEFIYENSFEDELVDKFENTSFEENSFFSYSKTSVK